MEDLLQRQGELRVATPGRGLVEITREAGRWLANQGAGDGLLHLFLRHTSAGLVIQENADPDVPPDLMDAFDRLAPQGSHWRHASEGPDDMPAHVQSALTGVNLTVPVRDGRLALGTWQGVFVAEFRDRPHQRAVLLTFQGNLSG